MLRLQISQKLGRYHKGMHQVGALVSCPSLHGPLRGQPPLGWLWKIILGEYSSGSLELPIFQQKSEFLCEISWFADR